MAEYSFPGSLCASKSVISCTSLWSLIPPVTVFRDCVTVSLDGELPARLQLLEVCEPMSQRQQQFRLVLARDGFGKPLVKRSRVFSCARKDLFVQHSQDRAA